MTLVAHAETVDRDTQSRVEAFWRFHAVTPQSAQRRSTDVTKRYGLSYRDALIFALGAAGMWGTQVATQQKTTSAISELGVKVSDYVEKQAETNSQVQRQVDQIRGRAELGVVLGNEAKSEAARLEGIMIGAGIKGAAK